MPTKKSKPKATSEVLQIEVMKTDPVELAKFAETPEGKKSPIHAASDGKGVTFGPVIEDDEHFGEGLPELGDERGLFDQWNLNLDIRVSYDREGNTYLEVARPGRGTFHKFQFSGIDYDDAIRATGQFNNRFHTFIINYGIDLLFNGLFWQRAKEKDRDEAYKAIIKSFENYFKSILKPKRKREIGTREINPGLTITTFEEVGGRPIGSKSPRTLSEREKTRMNLRSQKIADAIRMANNNENKSELAQIIGISTPTLRAWLRGVGITSEKKFYELIRQVESD